MLIGIILLSNSLIASAGTSIVLIAKCLEDLSRKSMEEEQTGHVNSVLLPPIGSRVGSAAVS